MGTRVADDRSYLVAHYTSVWSYLWPHISHSLEVGSVNLDWRAKCSLFMLWSVSYLTFNGHMEPRISVLQAPSSQRLCLSCPDSKAVADVCTMASKVAYESPKFIEFVVNQNWKSFRKKTRLKHSSSRTGKLLPEPSFLPSGEQKPSMHTTGAHELPQLGRVHLGFLEALDLGDRNRMQSFQRLKQNIYEKSRTPLPQTPTSGLPDFVLSDETKLLAYDHISAELVTILRNHRNAKLYITGHSLGGALATLFTAMLFYNREENRVFYNTEDDVGRRLAGLYTFGQPRVGDESFASFMDASLNKPTMRYFRVVYNNDVVARVPFDNSLFGFKHFGNCCYFTYNYTLQILPDEPFPNFLSQVYMVLFRLYALFELVQSFFMSYR
ncbi:hypothetical protein SELMODRAFT_407867 [Selaginella moellendorffii]|uniref:Fungal lipase-type domain-containing protein n=1 Tax=Selaginella moellendorffii TaxID=88036 RepID=D8R509_SELML|nr:hypothetical protein SELMODRAFT_407867 [Selaginella moellendorffii]